MFLYRSSWEGAAGHVELIPANRCWLGAGPVLTNGPRRPQRFRTTEILVNNRRHDFIAKGVDVLRCSLLRHYGKASATGEGVNERIDSDQGIRGVVSANAQGRIRRGDKIDMKKPALNLAQRHAASCGAVDGKEKFVFSRRWRRPGAKGGSDQAIGIAQACDRDGKPDRGPECAT